MTQKSLSVRQICFILFAYGAAAKLVLYPTLLAKTSAQGLIFAALFNFLIQGAVIWSVAYMSSRTDKTFFELINGAFGKTAARVIIILFALYFLLSSIVPINEQQLLMHSAFYDTVPSIYVFLPFFFFSVYAAAKGFKNIGRCADICLPIFVVCIAALMLMSAGEGEYSNLLPLWQSSSAILKGSFFTLFRFDESAILLMFIGRYTYKKGDAAKLTISYLSSGAVVVAMLAIFYAVYGALTPTRPFILSDIAVFFPAVSYVGRVDLILLFALDIVILFAAALRVQLCVQCLCEGLPFLKSSYGSVAANAILILITCLLNGKFSLLQSVAANWFYIPVIIFAYIVPLSCWCLRGKR